MLASTSRMLRASWRSGAVRDVYPDFNRLTLRITLEALFGAQLAGEAAGRDITGAAGCWHCWRAALGGTTCCTCCVGGRALAPSNTQFIGRMKTER
jgi:hypothetical protein